MNEKRPQGDDVSKTTHAHHAAHTPAGAMPPCTAPYLDKTFAHEQRRHAHERRFIVLCPMSSGIGSYLKSMVTVFYAAILG